MKRQLGFQMGLAGHRARRLPGTRPPVLSRRITGHCQAFTVSAFRVLVMEGDAEVVRGLCERVETRPRARPRAHPAVATRAAPRIDVVNPLPRVDAAGRVCEPGHHICPTVELLPLAG